MSDAAQIAVRRRVWGVHHQLLVGARAAHFRLFAGVLVVTCNRCDGDGTGTTVFKAAYGESASLRSRCARFWRHGGFCLLGALGLNSDPAVERAVSLMAANKRRI